MNETQIERLLPQGTSEETIKRAYHQLMCYQIEGLVVWENCPRCCAADPDSYSRVVYRATDENDLKRWLLERI